MFIAGVIYYLLVHLTSTEILPDAPARDLHITLEPKPERAPVIRRRE